MIDMISLMNIKTVRQQVKAKFYYNDCHDFSDEQNYTTTGRPSFTTMIDMISLMNIKTVRQQVKAKFYYNDCHDFFDEHQNCTTTGKGQILLQ